MKKIVIETKEESIVCEAEGDKGLCKVFPTDEIIYSHKEAERRELEPLREFEVDKIYGKNNSIVFGEGGDVLLFLE